jgi:hypothetical protein
MKILIAGMLTLIGSSAFGLITTNSANITVGDGHDWDQFSWQWGGFDDQSAVFGLSMTITNHTWTFKLARQSMTGQVAFLSTTSVTIATTNATVSIDHTNIPPDAVYKASLRAVDNATGDGVDVARGEIVVTESIYDDADGTYIFPTAVVASDYYLKTGDTLGGNMNGGKVAITNLASLILGNGTTGAGILQIDEDDDNGANNATFTVPALAADTDYTLPPDDGDSGERLQTDGSGVLTWEATSATTFDAIGDAAAATTIAFGDTEIVALDSSSDGEVFLTIDLLDADLATDTTALKITSVDNNDANYIPLHIQDDSAGGSPDDLLKLDYQGVLTLGDGTSAAGLTIGSAALVEAELEILDGLTATTAEIETLTDESNADALHGHSGVWAEAGKKLSFVSTNTAGTTVSIGNSSTMAADALVFSVTNAQNGVLFSIDEDGEFIMKRGITFLSSVFLSVYGLQATLGNIFTSGTAPYVHWQDTTTDEADWTLSADADDFIFTSNEVGEAMRILGDTGYIGVGTATPDEKFEVEWAGTGVDVEIGRGTTDTDQTFITLRSPDGTKFYIEVNDAGAISASTTKP